MPLAPPVGEEMPMSLASLEQVAPRAMNVTDALSLASRATGVDFGYLLSTAERESSLNPTAKSKSSSASGLFQFVEQTWLSALKAYGAEHGFAAAAKAIKASPSGRLTVTDPAERRAILALRQDPMASSMMAAELAKDSKAQLQRVLGRTVDDGELYLAHFFGPREAGRFIQASDKTPDAPAADSFPAAAKANRSVFYDGAGKARSFAQVEAHLLTSDSDSSGTVVADADQPSTIQTSVGDTTPLSAALFSHPNYSGPGAWMPASTPLTLTPQVLAILSSLDPVPDSQGARARYGNLFNPYTSF
jgi:hypothetical protein